MLHTGFYAILCHLSAKKKFMTFYDFAVSGSPAHTPNCIIIASVGKHVHQEHFLKNLKFTVSLCGHMSRSNQNG